MKKRQSIYGIGNYQIPGKGLSNNDQTLYEPHEIPEATERFFKLTAGNVVVMDDATVALLGDKFPLKDRPNFVITNDAEKAAAYNKMENVFTYKEERLERAMAFIANSCRYSDVYILLGTGELFEKLLKYCEKIFATEIQGDRPADTMWNPPKGFTRGFGQGVITGPTGIKYEFVDYVPA